MRKMMILVALMIVASSAIALRVKFSFLGSVADENNIQMDTIVAEMDQFF